MLKNKITGAIMAILIFAIMTAGAAQANTTMSEPNFAQMQSQAQQLPDFLANSSAVLMTDAEMAEIRGGAIPIVIVYAAILAQTYGVPVATAIYISASWYHFPVSWVTEVYNTYF